MNLKNDYNDEALFGILVLCKYDEVQQEFRMHIYTWGCLFIYSLEK